MRILFIFLFLNSSLSAKEFIFPLGNNFVVKKQEKNYDLIFLQTNKVLLSFDSLISSNKEVFQFYDNQISWTVYLDKRRSNETCVVAKNTKLGFQTFHLYSINPLIFQSWFEMHQIGENVQIKNYSTNSSIEDEFENAHIYQEIKTNTENLFFCRSSDFSFNFIYDCNQRKSFSVPVIDGIYKLENQTFTFFAHSFTKTYLFSSAFKLIQTRSASSNIDYFVWNNLIFAHSLLNKSSSFYQTENDNWSNWTDSSFFDQKIATFYYKDSIEFKSYLGEQIKVKLDSEKYTTFIENEKLFLVWNNHSEMLVINSSGTIFNYKFKRKESLKTENNQFYILKKKDKTKFLTFKDTGLIFEPIFK